MAEPDAVNELDVKMMMDVIVPELKDLEGKDIEVNQALGQVRITNEEGEVKLVEFGDPSDRDPAAQGEWIKIAEDGKALDEGIKALEQTEVQTKILLDIAQEQEQEGIDNFMNNDAFKLFAALFEALFSGDDFDFEGMFSSLKQSGSDDPDGPAGDENANDLAGFDLAAGDDMGTKEVDEAEVRAQVAAEELERSASNAAVPGQPGAGV